MSKIYKLSLILTIITFLISNQNVLANSSINEWDIKINAYDSYSITDSIKNIRLAQTCNEQTLIDGKIAPGTSGDFSIVIETENIGAEYDVIFDNFSSDFPKNLKFLVDGELYDLNNGFHSKLNGNEKVIHTVNWRWDYDAEDIFEGKDILDVSFDITVNAIQINNQTDEKTVQISRKILPKTGF